MSQTVLVVDDEPQIVRLMRAYLTEAGYRVLIAYNGEEALYAARREKPDLVLLDILMPKMDGMEFTRRIRREQNVPIIMLTARTEETDRIVGLELGADDYVTKPFSPREVVARVRAVLRRAGSSDDGSWQGQASPVIRVGSLALDHSTRSVTVEGRPIDLTPTEFDILAALMSAPGRVFSREEILRAVRGVAFDAYERTVDAHIKNLRQKIEPEPSDPRFVLTVRGAGYRLSSEMDRA